MVKYRRFQILLEESSVHWVIEQDSDGGKNQPGFRSLLLGTPELIVLEPEPQSGLEESTCNFERCLEKFGFTRVHGSLVVVVINLLCYSYERRHIVTVVVMVSAVASVYEHCGKLR